MGGNAAEGLSLVAYPRHDDRDLRPASVWNAGITSSPKRRIEARFCSWLMSPKPVWHNRCCTPASRNSATWSRSEPGGNRAGGLLLSHVPFRPYLGLKIFLSQ